mmetsp:Transcript_81253/g.243571  ORF Transcript_81253/g.243571 Transcript_81253/m.243571 type:complete len:516 (-) Transcript_81253:509-2056(-)
MPRQRDARHIRLGGQRWIDRLLLLLRAGHATPASRQKRNGDFYRCGPVTVLAPTYASTTGVALPLVLYLPGYMASAESFAHDFGLRSVLEQFGLIAVLAEGRRDAMGWQHWQAWGNWVGECKPSSVSSFDGDDPLPVRKWAEALEYCGPADIDVNYSRALVGAVRQLYHVDPLHIVAYGQSNGGAMAYRLACDAADLFTHVVVIAGAPPSGAFTCLPAKPVSVLHIGGTRDTQAPFVGKLNFDGAVRSCERFMSFDHCPVLELPPSASSLHWGNVSESLRQLDLSTRRSGVDTEVYEVTGCANQSRVTLWKMLGEWHTPRVNDAFRAEVAKWITAEPTAPPSAPPPRELAGVSPLAPPSSPWTSPTLLPPPPPPPFSSKLTPHPPSSPSCPVGCCRALEAACLACNACQSIEELCGNFPAILGCPAPDVQPQGSPPSLPDVRQAQTAAERSGSDVALVSVVASVFGAVMLLAAGRWLWKSRRRCAKHQAAINLTPSCWGGLRLTRSRLVCWQEVW